MRISDWSSDVCSSDLGSTISTVAIAIVPLILWLTRFGTIFPPDGRVKWGGWALCFACLLIPIGTEARTGLLCIMLLALLMLLHMKRRVLYGALMAFAVIVSIPFLPASFTNRMDKIGRATSELQSLMRISYAVFCLKNKNIISP